MHASVIFMEYEKQLTTPKSEAIIITKTKKEVGIMSLKQIAEALYKAIQKQDRREITFNKYDKLIFFKKKLRMTKKRQWLEQIKKCPM